MPKVILVNRCFVIRSAKEAREAGEEGKRLLIIQRASSDSHNAGKWEVPGGKLDEGQDLVHAQEREVLEETGFLVEPIHRLVLADSQVIGEGKYIGLPYVTLFSVTKLVGGELVLSDEHDDYAWVSYDGMLLYDLTIDVRKAAIILKPHLDI